MQKNFYIFLFVICVIATAVVPLKGHTWLNGEWCRGEVGFSNPGAVLNEYQVRINLNNPAIFTSAKIDGSDIRITNVDGISLLPFWIESWNAASTQATIWVKIPSVAASPTTTTIYLYYGNASATSASNGESTFALFDDNWDIPITTLNPVHVATQSWWE